MIQLFLKNKNKKTKKQKQKTKRHDSIGLAL